MGEVRRGASHVSFERCRDRKWSDTPKEPLDFDIHVTVSTGKARPKESLEGGIRRTIMIATLHLHEQFLFEHHQELQREMGQQRFLTRQPRKHFRLIRRLAALVGGLLMVWGPNVKRLEASQEQVAYEQ
jgi:hypothetical protein